MKTGSIVQISLLFFFYLFYCDAKIINPPSTPIDFTTKNTIFMFDVDDVLIERNFFNNWHDYWNILKQCNIIDIIKFTGSHLLHPLNFINTVQQEDIEKYLDKQAQEWPFLLKETPKGTILEQLKNSISKATPKKETINLMLNLYKQGYRITLATNQARSTLSRIINNKVLPDRSTYAMIFTSDCCTSTSLIKKPLKKYYECYKEALTKKQLYHEHIIFIDNTNENVEASAKEGILSVLFTDYSALKKDLLALKISVN